MAAAQLSMLPWNHVLQHGELMQLMFICITNTQSSRKTLHCWSWHVAETILELVMHQLVANRSPFKQGLKNVEPSLKQNEVRKPLPLQPSTWEFGRSPCNSHLPRIIGNTSCLLRRKMRLSCPDTGSFLKRHIVWGRHTR